MRSKSEQGVASSPLAGRGNRVKEARVRDMGDQITISIHVSGTGSPIGSSVRRY
jgi:hypothetical protein